MLLIVCLCQVRVNLFNRHCCFICLTWLDLLLLLLLLLQMEHEEDDSQQGTAAAAEAAEAAAAAALGKAMSL